MAAVLAHEIKNPLSGIRGAAQLLEPGLKDEDRALTQLICTETDRIRDLVDRMEVFGDERPLAPSRSTSIPCSTTSSGWRETGFADGIKINVDYDPSLPPLPGNRDKLIQAFLNLVKNAAEAIEEGREPGRIVLRTAFRPGVRLAVPGTGARVSLPLMIEVRGHRTRRPRRAQAPPVRSVRDDQAQGHRPRAGAGGQDHRRPRRRHRVRIGAQADRVSRAAAAAGQEAEARQVAQAGKSQVNIMAGGTVLIADDDSAIRTVLNQAFARAGYAPRATGNAATLWRWVAQGEGDVVITDVVMPDENAFDLIPRIKKLRPDLPIIVMSAQNTLMTALTAAEKGAFEYLPKPFDLQPDRLPSSAARWPSPARRKERGATPEADAEELPLIGRSPAMQEIYRVLARLTRTDLTVMITGESGTGKELVARVLHDYGQAAQRPVRRHQLAAIPRELIESELFGHEKGRLHRRARRAPRGASSRPRAARCSWTRSATCRWRRRRGCCACCRRASTPRWAAARRSRPTCASSPPRTASCKTQIQQGLFREDLYYRLNVVPLRIPPLRERLEDVGDLVRHFLRAAAKAGLGHKSIETAAHRAPASSYHWPGNVRELENMVRRLAALHPEDTLTADIVEAELAEAVPPPTAEGGKTPKDLSEQIERYLAGHFASYGRELPPPGLYDRILQHVERPLLMAALAATRGNQIRAAALLGLNRNTLRKKIRDLDIQVFRTPAS